MERDEEFRRLLTTILAAGVPEPAARLKQRLAAACREQGRPPFDHKTAGYKRFKHYLLRHADLITLSAGVGGDMVLSLREGASGATASLADTCPISIQSEEHTSALQSLMRSSYAVFCVKRDTPLADLR